MRLPAFAAATLAAALALPAPALASHALLDHKVPTAGPQGPLSTAFNAGGPGAEWSLITSIASGNPHTDIDFFTQDGDTFASVGTLAIGPNGGGQSIVRLTDGGAVAPKLVSSHPSASCLSNPSAALGLQHDVEATPKGDAILNSKNPHADRGDTQLLIDATDQDGRCHDQGGGLGLTGAPQGGLELIDVTDIENPVEIGLISHIGEAHTVNVDPKRPHIVYAVTSDAVAVTADGKRRNEEPGHADATDLDGFEVADISSCMNFPEGTSVSEKRAACRPEVYRYRYPSTESALGHTLRTSVYGCHELEVYPDDRLTCGGGNAAMVFDMAGAFDDQGTPDDFTDDTLRGSALPCSIRDSSSSSGFTTAAKVTDCVVGEGGVDLKIPNWIAIGSPSLAGVEWLGSVPHQGRGAGGPATPTYKSDEDIDFDHELELTESGRFLLATDERGGGVTPPGATCMPGADNDAGNGGISVYPADAITRDLPLSAEAAQALYAKQPDGSRALYRAKIRTKVEPTACTAHVFHQIPGQNRIFMGWYSQGTQVVDFVEHPDGTFEWREAGWFIPEHANQWVSHVFKMEENPDGTFTYWGATGDFALGAVGRNTVDVWKVTLPAPPKPLNSTGVAVADGETDPVVEAGADPDDSGEAKEREK